MAKRSSPGLDVVVAGAGMTGVSAAEWLRRDGHRVTLVDRVAPGDAAQASFGNAGLLACSAVDPVALPGLLWKVPGMLLDRDSPLFLRWSYLPRLIPWLVPFLRNATRARASRIARALDALVHDSVEQHRALARGTPAGRWIETGDYACLYRDRAAFAEDEFAFALKRACGFAWEAREGEALRQADPHLGPAYGFAAVFRDHGWIRDPGCYVADLAAWFEGQGGTVRRAGLEAVEPLPDGRAAVVAGGERIEADRVVVAAGAWSARLVARLGHRTALESERGYHLLLRGPSIAPPHPYMLSDAKFVATPMAAGLRCAGLVEFGGLDAPASAAPPGVLRRGVRRLYPALNWQSEESWLGQRPSTVDGLPLIGAAPRAPGIVWAFGAQHVGLTAGPKTGRLVADLVAGRPANIDLAPYRVGRFD